MRQYRRADSSPYAYNVTRALERSAVGGDLCEVFIDVDKIPLGTDFTQVLNMAMGSCDVALEIVGRNWRVTDGRRRLDDANDFVWAEVRQAISEKVPLVAVLVDGATLPSRSELPPAIRAFVDSRVVRLADLACLAGSTRTVPAYWDAQSVGWSPGGIASVVSHLGSAPLRNEATTGIISRSGHA